MSLEQAITDHASALRELASAIRSTISGAHEIGARTDRVISEAQKTSATSKKPDAKADVKPAAAAKVESKPEPVADEVPTYDEVKAKVLALAQAKGRDTLVDLLSRHGVTKAPDLKEAQYVAFLADIDAINAGTYDPAAAELA